MQCIKVQERLSHACQLQAAHPHSPAFIRSCGYTEAICPALHAFRFLSSVLGPDHNRLAQLDRGLYHVALPFEHLRTTRNGLLSPRPHHWLELSDGRRRDGFHGAVRESVFIACRYELILHSYRVNFSQSVERHRHVLLRHFNRVEMFQPRHTKSCTKRLAASSSFLFENLSRELRTRRTSLTFSLHTDTSAFRHNLHISTSSNM